MPVDCNTDDVAAEQKLEEYTNLRSPDAEERGAKRRKIEEAVKENIEQAQQKQKSYYDRKHGASASHQAGTLVKLKNFNRKKRKGFPLEGSVHHYSLPWQRIVSSYNGKKVLIRVLCNTSCRPCNNHAVLINARRACARGIKYFLVCLLPVSWFLFTLT